MPEERDDAQMKTREGTRHNLTDVLKAIGISLGTVAVITALVMMMNRIGIR